MISLNPKDWMLLGVSVCALIFVAAAAYKEYQYNSLKAEYAAYKVEVLETSSRARAEAEYKYREQLREVETIQAQYDKQIAVTSANLDAALRRVREYKRSADDRKPASASPAECGAYEASPTQLSEAHREFLVRLGAEADELAIQVNSLQSYIREITK